MVDEKKKNSVVAVLRVRGRVHVCESIEDTLKLLNLNKVNHCTLLASDHSKGMLKKVKDYVTWGEVDEKTIAELISKRGKTSGNKPIDDTYVKKHSKYGNIPSLAKAIAAGEAGLKDVEGLKPVFRLNPPEKGFERGGIKKSRTLGGALGYRRNEMSKLLERMM
jgi:large subunit ribosomal protein L30